MAASSSGKHCIAFRSDNDICINGDIYSDIILLVY